MRRLALVALALACAPTAAAADLTVAPRDFSPTTAGLNGSRTLAVSRLRVDRTAPLITEINAYNRSRNAFQGDNRRFTTISPNNDGLRDSAKIRFMLSEPARVHFEVTRTLSRPETIYELKAKLGAGRNVFTWFPPKAIGPRTYLLRITAEDAAGNRRTYGADNAREGRRLRSAVIRVLGVDAGFTAESYPASSTARLAVETDATSLTLQTFRAGPEDTPTHSDTLMIGVAVNTPVTIPWSARHRRAMLNFAVGPWPTGVYFVRLTASDGRIGYAPFIVRPTTLGSTSRVAVVMPTNTWQAYNFRDSDGNGWGDTWYAKGAQSTAALGRAYIRRGVPPQWRKYDVGVLRWLHMSGKQPEIITETDLESIRTAEELLGFYDLVVFSGHTEYVTRHEFNLIEGYRNLGGNLAFLSANNFFWEVHREGKILRRTRLWREMGRPESAIIGVQYRANDDGRIQRPFVVRSTTTAPWFWAGTGLTDGAPFGQELGGYGIEIDQTTVFTPPQTIVLADVPDLYGPGLTGQMTYYESGAAKVFAAGTLDFGGTATYWPVRRMLENLWARLTAP